MPNTFWIMMRCIEADLGRYVFDNKANQAYGPVGRLELSSPNLPIAVGQSIRAQVEIIDIPHEPPTKE